MKQLPQVCVFLLEKVKIVGNEFSYYLLLKFLKNIFLSEVSINLIKQKKNAPMGVFYLNQFRT